MRPHCASLLALIVLGATFHSPAFADEPPRARLLHLLEKPHSSESLDGAGYKGARFRAFKDDDVASPTFGTELCVLETPRSSSHLRVKDLQVEGSPSAVYEQPFAATALGVVTGGFFGLSTDGKPIPLGLVKSEGKSKTKMHPWTSGGVVAASENAVEIFPVRAFTNSPSWLNVIQSKPLLVEAGRDGIRASNLDRFDRSAVALTTKGEIVFFVIYEPGGRAASLAEFSQLLLRFRSLMGNLIYHALAMDGGPGAHLFIPALKKHCGAGTPNFIPNVLYLSK